jgi:hypothetical protein
MNSEEATVDKHSLAVSHLLEKVVPDPAHANP